MSTIYETKNKIPKHIPKNLIYRTSTGLWGVKDGILDSIFYKGVEIKLMFELGKYYAMVNKYNIENSSKDYEKLVRYIELQIDDIVEKKKNYKRGEHYQIQSDIYPIEETYYYSPPDAILYTKNANEYNYAYNLSSLIFDRHKSVKKVMWKNIEFIK